MQSAARQRSSGIGSSSNFRGVRKARLLWPVQAENDLRLLNMLGLKEKREGVRGTEVPRARHSTKLLRFRSKGNSPSFKLCEPPRRKAGRCGQAAGTPNTPTGEVQLSRTAGRWEWTLPATTPTRSSLVRAGRQAAARGVAHSFPLRAPQGGEPAPEGGSHGAR